MTVELLHMDCVGAMQSMAPGIIDLTVTSPPYDNLRNYNGGVDAWSDDVWKAVIAELYRVTATGGVVVWVVGDATVKGSESGTSFKQALYAKTCGFNLYDTMIFSRNTMPANCRRYQPEFEYMFVLSKGSPKTFNPIVEESKKAGKSLASITTRHQGQGAGDGLNAISKAGVVNSHKIKANIWRYHTGNGSTKDKYAHEHPAIFPEQLAADHISSWSNPGDTVLDPFMGSGTTGKMAVIAGRNFIGIERDVEYFQLASMRLADAETAQEAMF